MTARVPPTYLHLSFRRLGLTLCLTATLINTLSIIAWKHSHNVYERSKCIERPFGAQSPPAASRVRLSTRHTPHRGSVTSLQLKAWQYWLAGAMVHVISEPMNIASLRFIPQSVFAACYASSSFFNLVLSPFLLGESWTWNDCAGAALIAGGTVGTAMSASKSSQECVERWGWVAAGGLVGRWGARG